MNNPIILLVIVTIAALITIPLMIGFITIMYHFEVHPSITGLASAGAAIVIARFLAVPAIRKIVTRIETH